MFRESTGYAMGRILPRAASLVSMTLRCDFKSLPDTVCVERNVSGNFELRPTLGTLTQG